uniref:Uncharacterized protein n=1 Tax=Ditylenchus dipsaci TaxID=166011 RepID=A0A915EHK4_9BILA
MYKGLLAANETANKMNTAASNLSNTNPLNKRKRKYPSLGGAPYDDNINLLNVKAKLDNIRANKKQHPSEVNALYNQELARYLKMRKDANDKPVRVELVNGAKVITKASSPPLIFSPSNKNQTRNKRGLSKTSSLPAAPFTKNIASSDAKLLLPEDDKEELASIEARNKKKSDEAKAAQQKVDQENLLRQQAYNLTAKAEEKTKKENEKQEEIKKEAAKEEEEKKRQENARQEEFRKQEKEKRKQENAREEEMKREAAKAEEEKRRQEETRQEEFKNKKKKRKNKRMPDRKK